MRGGVSPAPDLTPRIPALSSRVRCFHWLRFVVRRRRIVLGRAGNLQLREWPCGAAGDFVANLHDVRHRAGVLERANRVVGVSFPLPGQLVEIHPSPRDGNLLMLRVGPGIGEMQIENQDGSGSFDFPGQGNGVFERVIGSVSYRRNKNANPERRPPMVHEDGGLIARLAVFLIRRERPAGGSIERRCIRTEEEFRRQVGFLGHRWDRGEATENRCAGQGAGSGSHPPPPSPWGCGKWLILRGELGTVNQVLPSSVPRSETRGLAAK